MKRYTKKLALGLAAFLLLYSGLPATAAALPGADRTSEDTEMSLPMDLTDTGQEQEETVPPMQVGGASVTPDPNNVYTAHTGGLKESTGDGTVQNPYNLFKDALANVADGGTIHVLEADSAFIDEVEAPNVHNPFIIDKNVTIRAANGTKGVIQVRAAGIALGANVTFENIELAFLNPWHSAIFSNGYHLTLNNVTRNAGSRLIYLFAGGLYSPGGSRGIPESGGDAAITITGVGEFGHIYGGTMNGSYTGNAVITVSGGAVKVGDVYSCGALESQFDRDDWLSMEEPPAPTQDAADFQTQGAVTVVIDDSNINNVFGDGATSTEVSIRTVNPYDTIEMYNIDKLTVAQGRVEPTELTGRNGIIDIDVSSAGTSDLRLTGGIDLSKLTQLPQVNHLTGADAAGENASRLILKSDATLQVGNMSGKFQFEAAGGFNGSSGMANWDHTYIRTANNTAVVNFYPYASQQAMKFEKTADGWKTSSQGGESIGPADKIPPFITTLEFPNQYQTVTKSNLSSADTAATWFADVQIVDPSLDNLGKVAVQYTVNYGGEQYRANLEKNTLTNSYEGTIDELGMLLRLMGKQGGTGFDTPKLVVQNKVGSEKKADIGDYEIIITAPSDNTTITKTVFLTVTDDLPVQRGDEKSEVTVQTGQPSYFFGETMIVTATAKPMAAGTLSGGSITRNEMQLYINGNLVETKTVESDGANVGAEFSVKVLPNHFVENVNEITVQLVETDHETLAGSVDKCMVHVQKVAAPVPDAASKTVTYDGSGHTLDGVTFQNLNDLPEPSYMLEYQMAGGVRQNKAVLPGQYTVSYLVRNSSVYQDTTEVLGSTLTVEQAKTLVCGETSARLENLSDGEYTLQATYTDMSAQKIYKETVEAVTFSVDNNHIPAADIVPDKSALDLATGQTARLRETVKPENATNQKAPWDSTNSDIAEAGPDGVVKVGNVNAGTAAQTVKTGSAKATKREENHVAREQEGVVESQVDQPEMVGKELKEVTVGAADERSSVVRESAAVDSTSTGVQEEQEESVTPISPVAAAAAVVGTTSVAGAAGAAGLRWWKLWRIKR